MKFAVFNHLLYSSFFRVISVLSFLLILAVLFAENSFCDSGKAASRIGIQKTLFGGKMINQSTGWVVGNEGLMLKTTDGGKSWKEINLKTEEPLYDVTFVDSNEGWVVGAKGLILHSSDGFNTFDTQNSKTENYLLRVLFLNKEIGFITGGLGTILFTVNGGKDWNLYPIDWNEKLKEVAETLGVVYPHLYDIYFVDDEWGWIVGENGVILHTTDGGKTWALQRGGWLAPLFSVYFKTRSEGWVVGQNGLFLHTTDGAHWTDTDLQLRKDLYKIRMSDNFGLVVGDCGQALITRDGGKSWKTLELEGKRPAWIVAFDFSEPKKSNSITALLFGKNFIETMNLHH